MTNNKVDFMKLVFTIHKSIVKPFKKYKINISPANILYHIPSSFISLMHESTEVSMQTADRQSILLLSIVLPSNRNGKLDTDQ